ncbi:SRPBCC family protein [Pseudonocardia sp.]|uniref:SRPBCC family protein n=1 Tax=Pseudonocardia sp. TaxID=60912 RepID=UPI003D0CD62A
MTATTHSAVVTLPTPTSIHVTREFAAPRHLVWRALTEPDLVKRWWSGERGEVLGAEIDLRVGGRWRYVMVVRCGSDFDGTEVGFHGEFREIEADRRIVMTEVFEGAPDATSLTTTVLDERDGSTTMTVLSEYECREHRDAVIDSGMELGMQEAYDKLERTAISLA